MRLPWGVVLLGAAVSGARAQDTTPSSISRTLSATASSRDSFSSSASPTSAGSSSAESSRSDTTMTTTVTVRSNDASTVTSTNTVTSTVTIRTTLFSTTVVTGNQETATSTVFETSTVTVNEKRNLGRDSARDARVPQAVEAVPTAPSAGGKVAQGDGRAGMAVLHRRAVTTVTVTVTQGGGDAVTSVVNKVFNTALTVPVTSVVTQTIQANARTTVTVTSTITVSSTSVAPTVEETPTAAASAGGGGNGGNERTGGSSDGGLSTGAKAGIGVGAGVGGLALIGIVAWLLLGRWRAGPKPEHDGFMGSSEVPVARPGGGNTDRPPMSQPTSTASYLSHGHGHQKPAEGYRGTAMGDGRAGYAQPGAASYGSSAYTPSRNTTVTQPGASHGAAGPDKLPRHPTPGDSSVVSPVSATTAELSHDGAAATAWARPGASEIDGYAVAGKPGQDGPVYEMPTQSYR